MLSAAPRWSEDELKKHLQKQGANTLHRIAEPSLQQPLIAKGVVRKTKMNKTEAEYAQLLEARKAAGEILWWEYEAITLTLADGVRYTPDFVLMLKNMEQEIHEVKGFMRDDARVKLRVAAEKFPYRFFLCRKQAKRDGGGWTIEEV